jgi:hypothetical protein
MTKKTTLINALKKRTFLLRFPFIQQGKCCLHAIPENKYQLLRKASFVKIQHQACETLIPRRASPLAEDEERAP